MRNTRNHDTKVGIKREDVKKNQEFRDDFKVENRNKKIQNSIIIQETVLGNIIKTIYRVSMSSQKKKHVESRTKFAPCEPCACEPFELLGDAVVRYTSKPAYTQRTRFSTLLNQT